VAASAEWPAAAPATEGLDTSRLTDLVSRVRSGDYGRIESLLVARNGRLVVEEYFGAGSAGQAHTMQSVTKSVVSLLTGIAVQKGVLRVDDRVTTFFPGYAPLARFDDRKAALTVRDLLTMRTGLDWSEDPYAGSPLQRLNECRCDWLRFVLDEGRFQGREIVAPEWIRESTRRVTTGVTVWSGQPFDYAYLWWLARDQGSDVVTAAGAQGQFVFVVPASRLVVVVTSENDDSRWSAPIGFLFSHILPAARPN
jgi:CubicO group peptidase (beta-lactamase class C family)